MQSSAQHPVLSTDLPVQPNPSSGGFLAVLLGAIGIGLAPLWIRLSELGPFATAAHRMLLSAPILYLWCRLDQRRTGTPSSAAAASDWGWLALAGFFFAGDMALWNWSLHLTTVANSTFITNLTPLLVMIAARVFLGERITRAYYMGMPIAFLGAFLMVRSSTIYHPDHLKGDLVSGAATVFYAGYLLTLRHLRRRLSTARLLWGSGLVCCALLFGVAAATERQLLPTHGAAWLPLIGLAWISHVGGQGLIAYGFGHMPAALGSLILLVQPVVATLLAAALLGESLKGMDILGGLLVLIGIVISTRRTEPRKPQ